MHIFLENGDSYEGRTVVPGEASGEIVFTTNYTGYEENITDPSYYGQALVFSYPLIGNYGVDERRFESPDIQPSIVIAREFDDSVKDWLYSYGVPAVDHVDTREIVKTIREQGSMSVGVAECEHVARMKCRQHEWPENYPRKVTSDSIYHYNESGSPTIALLDCGVKESMIERFVDRGAHVVRMPAYKDPLLYLDSFDLLFVSNGPGNPADWSETIDVIKHNYSHKKPIAGICLGQQLVTRALGGSTTKMKYGHRGSNQPVIDKAGHVRMTLQNHSFEVSEVPEMLEVTQRNVNDNSPEGIEGENVLLRQYHPEANPGPNDSLDFFDDVLDLI